MKEIGDGWFGFQALARVGVDCKATLSVFNVCEISEIKAKPLVEQQPSQPIHCDRR